MSIPAAVTTATVHHDAPVSFGGEPGQVMARFTPSATLIWGATGTPLAAFFDAMSPSSGAPLSIELPHTNQAGFVNGAGNSVTNWYYSVKIWYFKDGQKIALPSRDFQLPTGQSSVDLALIPSGAAVTPPASAPTAGVTSINGQTGAVVVAGLQSGQGVVFVTTGSEARPDGANLVFWVGGTTEPTNMASTDLWFTTAPAAAPSGDTTAPSVPTGLASSAITATTFTLNWSASTDAVGVTGYDVYLNSVLKTSTVGTTANITGLTGSTAYSVTVRAKDAAGNASAASTALSVTTSAPAGDTTAPTVPTGLASSAITNTSFTLNWNASTDAVGVTGYDVYRGATLATSVAGTTANITGLTASTAYSMTVRAKDAAGNVSAASTALSVTTAATADTTAPSAPTGLASSAITSSGFTLTWNAATDNVGVTGYDVFRDGVLSGSVTGLTANITGLTASTAYSMTVKAKDAVGNVSAASTALSVTTGAPASSPQHSIWGAGAYPWTVTKATDTPLTLSTGFYSYGTTPDVSAWRVVGAKLWIPAGVTIAGPLEFKAWKIGQTYAAPDLSATPAATANMTVLSAGSWNSVTFNVPIETNSGDLVFIGYRSGTGDFLGLTPANPQTFITAVDGSKIVMAENIEIPWGRSYYRYDGGATVRADGSVYAIDVIYDEGP